MQTAKLYELAARSGHRVHRLSLPLTRSLSVEADCCHIGIDKDIHGAMEKVCLAHELGHADFAGFYNRYTPHRTIDRIEYRAKKYSYEILMPVQEIEEAIHNGANGAFELADVFGVTLEFANEAVNYYKTARGVTFGC